MDEMIELDIVDLKKGFRYDTQASRFICAVCGQTFENGEIFKAGERFYDAQTMITLHMNSEHGGVFGILQSLDKRLTGLTENQKELLGLIHDGVSDRDIAMITGTAAATIRHQRFVFREKARQARLYLAIFELALEGQPGVPKTAEQSKEFMEIHRGAKMVDERYLVTKAEENRILSNMFLSLDPLRLKALSPKEKKKIVILKRISEEFETGRKYSEKELNAILKDIHEDFATLRRYLIEYGFMNRTQDCAEYWRI